MFAAIFGSTICLSAPILAQPKAKTIAITIDDLPCPPEGFSLRAIQDQTRRLLLSLQTHRVPAIGFVNEDKLFVRNEVDARIALLNDWLDAGMELGNHGFGHLSFEHTTLAAYEDAVIKGEVVTQQLLVARGLSLRYYRFPYNQTGPTLAERNQFATFLSSRSYRVAPFTIEDDDPVFASVYADDVTTGNSAEAEKVRISYVANFDRAIDAFESMSQSLFGRQISQILIIHANRLNADTLDQTLNHLQQRGYSFVSIKTALADAAYSSPDGYVGPAGMSWLHRWAIGMNHKVTPLGQPDPDEWIQKRDGQIYNPQKESLLGTGFSSGH